MNFPSCFALENGHTYNLEAVQEMPESVKKETGKLALLSLRGPRNGQYSAVWTGKALVFYTGFLECEIHRIKWEAQS